MAIPNILLFALGIAALAVPLWVHLRLGRVRKRTVVSSLHLMLAAPQSSRTPRRIVNWPLFLLRCLLLLLIALAFGRLLIPMFGGERGKAYVACVIDVSGSMQARADGQPVWDQAAAALDAALANLDPASLVAIIPSPPGNTRPVWESPSQARARAAALRPGYAANRLPSEIRQAARLLAELPGDNPKLLHILSDFQRTSLAGADSLSLPANIDLQIHPFGPPRMPNRGLTVSIIPAGATDLGFYAITDGSSDDVRLIENDTESTFRIAPGQSAARIATDPTPGRWTERTLILDSEDALAADNTAHDVFEPQQPIPIWLYEPRGPVNPVIDLPIPNRPNRRPNRRPPPPPARPAYGVNHTYEQASYFLATALQPGLEGAEMTARSRFQPRQLTTADLPAANESATEPDAPRILFIPAAATVPPPLATLARTILTRGGTVIFFAGPEIIPAAYQAAFGEILPVRIDGAEPVTLIPALAAIDDRHPLWGGLDPQTRSQMAAVAIRERNTITPAADTRILAQFADATPLIVEAAHGENGRAYFINTSADRAWSDWPADPNVFLPAIHLLTARVLESVARGRSDPYWGDDSTDLYNPSKPVPVVEAGRTRIFLHPPKPFHLVNALLTNFHLPQSTLLMLVSAFAAPGETDAGRQLMLETYRHAIEARYRFFSYGDAMLIL